MEFLFGPLKQVKLGDNDIKFVAKSKCLGMILDSQLSWKLQIGKVKTDMSCKIKKLKLMRYLPKEVLSSVFKLFCLQLFMEFLFGVVTVLLK